MNTTPLQGPMPPRAPLRLRSIVHALAATLLLLGLAGPVLAHADLVSSDPADKAVLTTPPTAISLVFSEDLDAAKSSFKLLGPSGTVGSGQVGADATGMTLDGLSLAPGDYEIQWTSAALDGDILRGTLTFTVAEPTPAPATPTPPPSDSAEPSAAPSLAPSVEPTRAPTPAPSATPAQPAAGGGDVLLPIVAALLIVAGIGVYVLRRSRRA